MDILSIQYLRGIAAMMVVAVHLHPQLERMGYQGYWPHWLASGVDIFFGAAEFLDKVVAKLVATAGDDEAGPITAEDQGRGAGDAGERAGNQDDRSGHGIHPH